MLPQTIDTFARELRAGRATSAAITEACLQAITARDRELNAFITVMADEARRAALQADREIENGLDRGPLHGVPVSLKDLFDVAATVTTAASQVREGLVAHEDAALVQRLRAAGAIIVGKTNLHEFALGTTNEDSAFGPARHPDDPSRSPGGSSGGSAVSVAAGMALASVGTDTGGSVRIPAAACGLVGLKPCHDELPSTGIVPLSRTLDHPGPITRTVTDAWHMMHALRGTVAFKPLSGTAVSRLRLAVPRRFFCEVLDDDVAAAFERSLTQLGQQGATLVEVDIPHAGLIASVYVHILFGDAAAYHGPTLDRIPERYTANVRMRLETARYVLAEDYVRALDGRQALRHEVDAALMGQDALVLPTLPIVAPPIGAAAVEVRGAAFPVRNAMLRLTQLFNVTGHPAVTVPCRPADGVLPCGLQLAGHPGQTDTLLHAARGVEDALAR